MQTITRTGSFDSMHRVMNEKFKCHNIHGHTYLYELTFEFDNVDSIGYAIDFKEIKRVCMQWIDDTLDHGAILNPQDHYMEDVCKTLGSKTWLMSLAGMDTYTGLRYCNPSVENIAKEIYLAMHLLMSRLYGHKIRIKNVRIRETPNCFTDCTAASIGPKEKDNFYESRRDEILMYADEKGVLNYDDRNQAKAGTRNEGN